MSRGVPTYKDFKPVIPYQAKVIKLLAKEANYDKGVHEVFLSGSVGCLREDALIETVYGSIPISDIKKQDYLLSYSHNKDQFVFAQGSDSFPKDKDYLYRVITTHGEFVASGNHHIATSDHNYLPVSFYHQNLDKSLSASIFLEKTYPLAVRKSLLLDVLNSWQKLSNFLCHCVKHIRQYGPQFQEDLKTFEDCFPLLADAQEYGQFSYCYKLEQMGDLLALELKHAHTFELCGHQTMKDFLSLLGNKTSALVDVTSETKPLERMIYDILLFQQFHLNDAHPNAVLFFLSKICRVLSEFVKPCSIHTTNGAILSIEKQNKKEWYWDIQVPNTNNYISNGMIHHNSAKSTLLAHMAVRHIVNNPGAILGLARRAMPDLKDTIYQDICEHLEGTYLEDKHYIINRSNASIRFSNGSRIVSRSWADKKYMKWRSLRLSAAIVEEVAENDEEDKMAIDELRMRVGRIPGIRQKFILYATNPDSPEHWAYKYFIQGENELRRVFYSKTIDNPFLPQSYMDNLKTTLDPLMYERMVEGKWIRIAGETLYRQYSKEKNFINESYKINPNYPIRWGWDFNIGEGKPMSTVFSQYINGKFHFFKEIIIEGTRTEDICDEAGSDGILNHNMEYLIHGDATGKSRTTKSHQTDYDIIRKFLSNYKTPSGEQIRFRILVPQSNPPLRKRHNLTNGVMLNAAGETRLYVYKDCPILDEGFLLTKLKPGGNYIEDDSKKYQHSTTAAGFTVCSTLADELWSNEVKLLPR